MADAPAQEAIEDAYRAYATQLWQGVYAYSGGRREVADDAVAEAFARALEHADRIRAPLPWLYRVAFRQATARMREERQSRDLHPGGDDSRFEPEQNSAVALLQGLAPKQRAILFLFYYADLSVADIARATGSSQVAVRVQMHRARAALRRTYATATALREEVSPGGST
jgi:RNA polymerase sigma-70 factor (ECF subfamily)